MFRRPNVIVHEETRINVTQQPNDAADAARLYGECVKKARKEVADAVIQELGAHNVVKVVRASLDKDYANYDNRVRILFTVNGHSFDFISTIPEVDRDVAHALGLEILHQVERMLRRPL